MKSKIRQILKDIKSIRIQGATNIAKASIGALADFSRDFKGKSPIVFLKKLEKVSKEFYNARPDEPLNQNLLAFIIAKVKEDKSLDIKKRIANLEKYCNDALGLISKNEDLIMSNGALLIKKIQKKKSSSLSLRGASRGRSNLLNIFTHCRSSSVQRILIEARKEKIPFKVYDSETRPRFQGRILAKNLTKAGINVTMMVDSAAAFVFSENDPDGIDIDLVIIGADVISKEGAILNKIGSYSLALSAKEAKIPFYTAASLLKTRHDFASFRNIKIEKRDPTELWQRSLKGLKVMNYAFDIVPPEYITGFITEFGIVKPKDVKKMAVKKYGEIFK